MTVPVPNGLDSSRVPWIPTDGPASDKHIFFILFGVFLTSLVAIAHWSYAKPEAQVPADELYRWHFLGGKSYSMVLGTFTMFSTIFSATTIAGVPYEASVTGFQATRWLTGGMWIGLGAVILYPRFYRLNGLREYDCPNDFVSDRFNNRALTMLSSLIAIGSVIIYMITQFFAIADLIPTLSKGVNGQEILDGEATTWVLAAVVLVCEWAGGFDAVTWTDMIQSVVLIVAFIAIPITYGVYYGDLAGAADSFGYDCPNYFILNCTQQAFIDFGSPCASAATAARYETGCLTYGTLTNLELYPAVEESFYWKPLTKVAESGCTYNYNQSLSSCIPTVFTQLGWFQAVPPSMWLTLKSTFPVPGPYSEERAWAQKPVQSPLPTYLGTDGVTIYNRAAWNMFSFSLLFFSLSLFPHWMMKPMCLKSDKELKFTMTVISVSTLWSVFLMILVGITGGALLKGIYPDAGSNFFAIILDDMANRGGAAEYVAAFGGVGAIAAMMSTIDSALISVTNHISTDFLRHWLARKTGDTTLIRMCNGISLVVITITAVVALYSEKLKNDDQVYATLITWQSSLLWQILPVFMLAIYFDMNGWACFIAQIFGLAAITGFYVYQDSCHNWNTAYSWEVDSYVYNQPLSDDNHPEACDPSTYYFDFHIWAALVNVFVAVVLSIVFNFLEIGHTAPFLEMAHVQEKFGIDGGGHLTISTIRTIMADKEEGIKREPVKDPIAIFCIISVALLSTFSLPWWEDSFYNCDYDSYQRWKACEIAGAPCQAMCDVADMSLAPPVPVPVAMTAASACLSNPNVTCSCPLQGGYMTFVSGSTATMIPTDPVANVSFDATVASLATGGGIVYQGTGNGKICEGPDLLNGIPKWATIIFVCYGISMFLSVVAWLRWDTVDHHTRKHARRSKVKEGMQMDVVMGGFGFEYVEGEETEGGGLGRQETKRRDDDTATPRTVTQL